MDKQEIVSAVANGIKKAFSDWFSFVVIFICFVGIWLYLSTAGPIFKNRDSQYTYDKMATISISKYENNSREIQIKHNLDPKFMFPIKFKIKDRDKTTSFVVYPQNPIIVFKTNNKDNSIIFEAEMITKDEDIPEIFGETSKINWRATYPDSFKYIKK